MSNKKFWIDRICSIFLKLCKKVGLDMSNKIELGSLSSRYESNGNPGAINKHDDDHGGESYGAYQFYSGSGSVQAFVAWMMQSTDAQVKTIGQQLFVLVIPSDSFNLTWQQVAEESPDVFLQAQHDFCEIEFYNIAATQLQEIGFNVITMSDTIKNVIWSCAVQYGPYKVPILFQQAAQWIGEDLATIPDNELFMSVYFMRATDPWNKNKRAMLFRMFEECHDALDMFKTEKS